MKLVTHWLGIGVSSNSNCDACLSKYPKQVHTCCILLASASCVIIPLLYLLWQELSPNGVQLKTRLAQTYVLYICRETWQQTLKGIFINSIRLKWQCEITSAPKVFDMLYIRRCNHMRPENKDVKMTAAHKHIQTHLICIQRLRCVCEKDFSLRKVWWDFNQTSIHAET